MKNSVDTGAAGRSGRRQQLSSNLGRFNDLLHRQATTGDNSTTAPGDLSRFFHKKTKSPAIDKFTMDENERQAGFRPATDAIEKSESVARVAQIFGINDSDQLAHLSALEKIANKRQ